MTKPTLTTLSRLEATTLQSFIGQVDTWHHEYSDKADKVEITYYPEDDGFEVLNNEPNNGVLPRNRATRFRTELFTWANQMLNQLTGWDNSKTITVFKVMYKDGKYGVACEVADKVNPSQTDEQNNTDEASHEL